MYRFLVCCIIDNLNAEAKSVDLVGAVLPTRSVSTQFDQEVSTCKTEEDKTDDFCYDWRFIDETLFDRELSKD